MIYQKVLNLLNEYMQKERDADQTERFCNQYMDIFFKNSDELESEVSQLIFERLDDINLVYDSYEKNPEIRKDDIHCIDENELRKRINNLIKMLNTF